MREAFRTMYQHDLILIDGLRKAVADGALTEEDLHDILGEEPNEESRNVHENSME